ncbi:ATP cone domain-containing protein [Clostridium sp. B9]|uniref:ATP cone domain-containing protein n=1 Tax=Clostridium sp. B9 TaxID=3423224 RepID=UPI003D2EC4E8
MNIIKKDGRREAFKVEKLATSLMNAANDLDLTLNDSDVNVIAKDVEKIIRDLRGEDTPTSSYEVIGVIIGTLKNEKFEEVVKAYTDYKK